VLEVVTLINNIIKRFSAPVKTSANSSGVEAEDGVILKCGRCGWMWKYRGLHTVYVSCPNCYAKVKLLKKEVFLS
jgi:uncharacterized C2H2 Zn-finger protein